MHMYYTQYDQSVVETSAFNAYALGDTVLPQANIICQYRAFCMNWNEFVPNLWPISAIDYNSPESTSSTVRLAGNASEAT